MIKRFVDPLCIREPLRWLSPSGLITFRECRLHGLWQAAHKPPILPSSPAARLGSIVHNLLEEAGRGLFAPAHEANLIEARWRELIVETEREMAGSILEKRFLPLEKSIPKFDVIRIRALARAADLSREISENEIRAGEVAVNPYGYELLVKSSDGSIVGRIDRILPGPEGPVLQDYKSGSILDDQNGDLKPEYTTQLHLYSALYHDETGVWPGNLQIVPLSGAPHDVSYSRAECLNLLEEARNLLTQVNDYISCYEDDWDAVETMLATPSPTACRFCTYRPACMSYLSRYEVDADAQWPPDVWGSFVELVRLGNGRLMLSITSKDGSNFFVRDISDTVADGAKLDIITDKYSVGIFNARRTKSPNALEEGALTMICCVNNENSTIGTDEGSLHIQ